MEALINVDVQHLPGPVLTVTTALSVDCACHGQSGYLAAVPARLLTVSTMSTADKADEL